MFCRALELEIQRVVRVVLDDALANARPEAIPCDYVFNVVVSLVDDVTLSSRATIKAVPRF
jgi:hypothetical protein